MGRPGLEDTFSVKYGWPSVEEAARAHSASNGLGWPGGSAAGTFSVKRSGLAWRKRRGHIRRQTVWAGLEEAARAHSASNGLGWPGGSGAGTFGVKRSGLAWRKRRGHIRRQMGRPGLEEARRARAALNGLAWPGGRSAFRSVALVVPTCLPHPADRRSAVASLPARPPSANLMGAPLVLNAEGLAAIHRLQKGVRRERRDGRGANGDGLARRWRSSLHSDARAPASAKSAATAPSATFAVAASAATAQASPPPGRTRRTVVSCIG